MNKRPRSITIVSWILIAIGVIAFLHGALPSADITFAQRIAELKGHWFVHVARIVIIVGGVSMLYGFNWARCIVVAWLVFHVVLGALHSPLRLLIHVLLLLVILYFLFRPAASAYFRSK